MLNVNKISIFLLLGFIATTLNAIDISNFDIDGFKFNSHISDIKKQMNMNKEYNSKEIETQYHQKNGKTYKNIIYSYNYRYNGVRIIFNGLGYITDFEKKIIFNGVSPSFKSIKDKTIKKYGNSSSYNLNISNGSAQAICYGDCTKNGDWSMMYDCQDKGTCLRITLFKLYGSSPFLEVRYINDLNKRKNSQNIKYQEKLLQQKVERNLKF